MHSEVAGLQDIDAVDLFDGGRGHGEGDGFLFNDGSEQLTIFFGDLFRVVQQGVMEIGWEDHRRGEYRSGIAASTGFIEAGFALILF